ncbi:hypothetical protein CAOG_003858 [Capsaspora owczarzaki ATCC 30864]|uniref:Uncharacterized protein n=2 Tax=Capsaspora owczarzaki (strain ATCC 30864) TaxID=595528 RepID=A0A0D2UD50_CAPO3|nr:hypothetical protein CAOG_003858 [Capsaspora owczarzaki ATCC 30864]
MHPHRHSSASPSASSLRSSSLALSFSSFKSSSSSLVVACVVVALLLCLHGEHASAAFTSTDVIFQAEALDTVYNEGFSIVTTELDNTEYLYDTSPGVSDTDAAPLLELSGFAGLLTLQGPVAIFVSYTSNGNRCTSVNVDFGDSVNVTNQFGTDVDQTTGGWTTCSPSTRGPAWPRCPWVYIGLLDGWNPMQGFSRIEVPTACVAAGKTASVDAFRAVQLCVNGRVNGIGNACACESNCISCSDPSNPVSGPPQLPTSTSSCFACSSNCVSCDNNGCLTCVTPYVRLSNLSCALSCDTHQYASANAICASCAESCASCAGTATNCTSCSSGTVLVQNECVAPSSATPSVTPSEVYSVTPSEVHSVTLSEVHSVTPSEAHSVTPSSATPSSATPSSATPVSVTPSLAAGDPTSSEINAAAIGAGVGGGVLLLLLLVLLILLRRRRKSKNANKPSSVALQSVRASSSEADTTDLYARPSELSRTGDDDLYSAPSAVSPYSQSYAQPQDKSGATPKDGKSGSNEDVYARPAEYSSPNYAKPVDSAYAAPSSVASEKAPGQSEADANGVKLDDDLYAEVSRDAGASGTSNPSDPGYAKVNPSDPGYAKVNKAPTADVYAQVNKNTKSAAAAADEENENALSLDESLLVRQKGVYEELPLISPPPPAAAAAAVAATTASSDYESLPPTPQPPAASDYEELPPVAAHREPMPLPPSEYEELPPLKSEE